MSNANSFLGFANLPQIYNPGTTGEFAYVVPPVGLYGGLPSPSNITGDALFLSPDTGAGQLDGRLFKIRVAGVVSSHTSQNITFSIRQYNSTLIANGPSTSNFTGTNVVFSSGAVSTGGPITSSFYFESQFQWSSVSGALQSFAGYFNVNGIGPFGAGFLSPASPVTTGTGTSQSGTAGVVGLRDLNFVPTFQFSLGGPADNIALAELYCERI